MAFVRKRDKRVQAYKVGKSRIHKISCHTGFLESDGSSREGETTESSHEESEGQREVDKVIYSLALRCTIPYNLTNDS